MEHSNFQQGIAFSLIALITVFVSANKASAQEKKPSASDQKSEITIHISRDVNGEVVKYDTTFEAGSDFDVEAFLDTKDLGMKHPEPELDRHVEFFNFETPEPGEEFPKLPDSIGLDSLMRGVQRMYGEIMKKFPGGPDMKWNFNVEPPDSEQEHPQEFQWQDKNPRTCCPFHNNSRPNNMCLPQFPGMDIAPFIGNSRPEKVIIHKKRHGKKVVITYEDDDEFEGLKDDEVIIYRNDRDRPHQGQMQRQYRNENPDGRKQVEVQIEEGKPDKGEKRVIIIEKKIEEDKK